ncbi:MAG: XkdF-like putative serine protease domain-containing protein [Bacilli bacterium]
METYNLILNDETEGVFAISLVDAPAVEYNFLFFSKDELNFSIFNNDKREVFGVIMLADTPIPRKSNVNLGIGNHNVIFNKETIKNIVLKYSKNKYSDQVTLGHKEKAEGIYLFESYIIDRDNGINPPIPFSNIPDGSWIGKFKVDNEDIWTEIKNGTFKGFSIEGEFKYDIKNEELEFFKDVHKILSKIK